jgi:hypothetical protein
MARSNLAEDFSPEAKLAALAGGRKFGTVSETPPPTIGIPALRADDLHLGNTAANIPIGLSLPKLIAGRLLIQGNSGAGKSMLLRRLFEQAFGRVQQLLIDLDGEFSTLAEHFDVAVLSSADVLRIGAHAFALHLREHRYSAILDLSDATADERMKLMADLATGLIDAQEEHWHPLLVLVDEAQVVAPRQDLGDVDPALRKQTVAALADMMGRGRKRGIAGIIATQRLGETSIAISSKATNIICGRTIFDRDLERASGILGFTIGQGRALRSLVDGEFICLGPAICGPKRVRFRTAAVKSRHKGSAPELIAPPKVTAAATGALLKGLPSATTNLDGDAATGDTHRRGSGRRGRDWAQAEDAIIRAGYERGAAIRDIGAELAAIGLSTSTSNISSRAHSLGLISASAAIEWRDREDEIVRDAYAREVRIMDISTLLAAEGFRRSRQSIQMRAIALGITRDRVNYWKPDEEAIALAGINSGKSTREIIADLAEAGFSRGITGITKLAQRHNITRGQNLPWSAEEETTLRTMYADKKPVQAIADALGKSRAAVATMASKLGLKQRQAWADEEKEKLRRLHTEGYKLVDCVAELPGRTYATVARMSNLMRLDFTPNRNRAA